MGYSKTGLVDGNKATCASFVNVGVEVEGVKGVYLTQLVPEGADTITLGDNTVEIQTLGPTGKGDLYFSYHKGDKRPYKTDGWYNDSNELITEENDVFIPNGTGLWMSGTAALTFTSSGEVLMDSQNFKLVDGNRLVANPFPTKIKLTSLVPAGVDTITLGDNTVEIQTLGPTGKGDLYFSYHKGDKRPYKTDGWYNDSNELITEDNDVEFAAGLSLWTSGTKDIDLTIITPFEDAE